MAVYHDVIPWIWVTLLGSPINKMIEILESEYGTLQNAYDSTLQNQYTENILKCEKLAQNMKDKTRLDKAEEIYEQTEKLNMRVIYISSSKYPDLLRELPSAPAVLYCYGKMPCEFFDGCNDGNKLLSVVGARKCSAYGYETTFGLSKHLAERGIGIVSGMARGVDTAAHRGAIDADGYTVAVLGSGANVIYPQENARLYHVIRERGLIISEYPPNTPPARYNFPARNRIIAGISPAVTVIEAGVTSGAMITAGIAGDIGRDVFAVPGNIDNPLSVGCNKLIQSGALCVTEYKDVLCEYNMCDCDTGKNTLMLISKYENDSDERIVYDLIKSGVRENNEMIKKTGIPAGRLLAVLTVLEIEKIIEKHSDGLYFVK